MEQITESTREVISLSLKQNSHGSFQSEITITAGSVERSKELLQQGVQAVADVVKQYGLVTA